jgi:Protein of unknown function (DUF2867)
MPAEPSEFRRLDLRCHTLLDDVPLHDVWAIPLNGGGPDRTMLDVRAVAPLNRRSPNLAVRGLVTLRLALGRLLGWDEERHDASAQSYVHRLTDDDRARSRILPGTKEGLFRALYVFPDEAVYEVRNATVHAFLASALVARSGGYLLYWAIYVKPVGRLTPVYLALITPFRRFIVYPALIRDVQAAWSRVYS